MPNTTNPYLPGYQPPKKKTTAQTDYQRVLQEIANAQGRLGQAGQAQAGEPARSPGFLGTLFDLLSRPIHGINTMLQEFADPNVGFTPGVKDPLKAFWRGLSGQEKTWGRDLARSMGISDEERLFKLGPWEPTKASLAGTLMDVFNPLDPLNWILPGVSKAPIKGAETAVEALTRILGEKVTSKFFKGMAPDTLAKLAKPASIGELLQKFTAFAYEHKLTDDPQKVVKALTALARKRGFNITDKLSPSEFKRLSLGIQVPGFNKKIGTIPLLGTEHLVKGVEWAGDKLTDIPLIDQLLTKFSTKYVSKTVPSSVAMRGLAGAPIISRPGADVMHEVVEGLQAAARTARIRATTESEQALREIFEGMSLQERKDVKHAVALGKEASFTSERLRDAAKALKKYYASTLNWMRGFGLSIKEMDPYVPLVVTGGRLRKGEAAVVRAAFGGGPLPKIDDLELHRTEEFFGKFDPHLKRRTTLARAVSPRQVNELLGREWLAEDPLVSGVIRARHASMAEEVSKFISVAVEQYGLDYKAMMKWFGSEGMPPGYVAVHIRPGDYRPELKIVDELTQGLLDSPEHTIRFMPEALVNAYNEYAKLFFNEFQRSSFEKLFNDVTSWFRTVAYLWNWGHYPRDFSGNVEMGWLGGLRNFTRYPEAGTRLWRGINSWGRYEDIHAYAEMMIEKIPAGLGEPSYHTLYRVPSTTEEFKQMTRPPRKMGKGAAPVIAETTGDASRPIGLYTTTGYPQGVDPRTLMETHVKGNFRKWASDVEKDADIEAAFSGRFSSELNELGFRSWKDFETNYKLRATEITEWDQVVRPLHEQGLTSIDLPAKGETVGGIAPMGEYLKTEIKDTRAGVVQIVKMDREAGGQILLIAPDMITPRQLDSIVRAQAATRAGEVRIILANNRKLAFLQGDLKGIVDLPEWELFPLDTLEQMLKRQVEPIEAGLHLKRKGGARVLGAKATDEAMSLERSDGTRALLEARTTQGSQVVSEHLRSEKYDGIIFGSSADKSQDVCVFEPGSVKTISRAMNDPQFGKGGQWNNHIPVKGEDGAYSLLDNITLVHYAQTHGITGVGAGAAEFVQRTTEKGNRLSRALNRYTEISAKATVTVDDTTRFAVFIDRLYKGDTLAQAAAHTKLFLFDYWDLTPFERYRMRQFIPFYTWLRKNIPLQLTQMVKQPGKFATFAKIHGNITEPYDTEDVPNYLEEAEAILLRGSGPGKGKFMIPYLPYQDLSKIPSSVSQVRELLGAVNPLIRFLPETLLNTQFFSGRPLENYPGETTPIPFLGQLEKLGIKMPEMNKRFLGYTWEQMPFFRNLGIMSDPENPRWATRTGSFFGLPPTYGEERTNVTAAYEERDRLRAVIRKLQDLGVAIEDTDAVKKEAFLKQLSEMGINLSPDADLQDQPTAIRRIITLLRERNRGGGG